MVCVPSLYSRERDPSPFDTTLGICALFSTHVKEIYKYGGCANHCAGNITLFNLLTLLRAEQTHVRTTCHNTQTRLLSDEKSSHQCRNKEKKNTKGRKKQERLDFCSVHTKLSQFLDLDVSANPLLPAVFHKQPIHPVRSGPDPLPAPQDWKGR